LPWDPDFLSRAASSDELRALASLRPAVDDRVFGDLSILTRETAGDPLAARSAGRQDLGPRRGHEAILGGAPG
jgi:hypothetical protein